MLLARGGWRSPRQRRRRSCCPTCSCGTRLLLPVDQETGVGRIDGEQIAVAVAGRVKIFAGAPDGLVLFVTDDGRRIAVIRLYLRTMRIIIVQKAETKGPVNKYTPARSRRSPLELVLSTRKGITRKIAGATAIKPKATS